MVIPTPPRHHNTPGGFQNRPLCPLPTSWLVFTCHVATYEKWTSKRTPLEVGQRFT